MEADDLETRAIQLGEPAFQEQFEHGVATEESADDAQSDAASWRRRRSQRRCRHGVRQDAAHQPAKARLRQHVDAALAGQIIRQRTECACQGGPDGGIFRRDLEPVQRPA